MRHVNGYHGSPTLIGVALVGTIVAATIGLSAAVAAGQLPRSRTQPVYDDGPVHGPSDPPAARRPGLDEQWIAGVWDLGRAPIADAISLSATKAATPRFTTDGGLQDLWLLRMSAEIGFDTEPRLGLLAQLGMAFGSRFSGVGADDLYLGAKVVLNQVATEAFSMHVLLGFPLDPTSTLTSVVSVELGGTHTGVIAPTPTFRLGWSTQAALAFAVGVDSGAVGFSTRATVEGFLCFAGMLGLHLGVEGVMGDDSQAFMDAGGLGPSLETSAIGAFAGASMVLGTLVTLFGRVGFLLLIGDIHPAYVRHRTDGVYVIFGVTTHLP